MVHELRFSKILSSRTSYRGIGASLVRLCSKKGNKYEIDKILYHQYVKKRRSMGLIEHFSDLNSDEFLTKLLARCLTDTDSLGKGEEGIINTIPLDKKKYIIPALDYLLDVSPDDLQYVDHFIVESFELDVETETALNFALKLVRVVNNSLKKIKNFLQKADYGADMFDLINVLYNRFISIDLNHNLGPKYSKVVEDLYSLLELTRSFKNVQKIVDDNSLSDFNKLLEAHMWSTIEILARINKKEIEKIVNKVIISSGDMFFTEFALNRLSRNRNKKRERELEGKLEGNYDSKKPFKKRKIKYSNI